MQTLQPDLLRPMPQLDRLRSSSIETVPGGGTQLEDASVATWSNSVPPSSKQYIQCTYDSVIVHMPSHRAVKHSKLLQ